LSDQTLAYRLILEDWETAQDLGSVIALDVPEVGDMVFYTGAPHYVRSVEEPDAETRLLLVSEAEHPS